MDATCVLTVGWLTTRRWAISGLVNPVASQCKTSRSRLVSPTGSADYRSSDTLAEEPSGNSGGQPGSRQWVCRSHQSSLTSCDAGGRSLPPHPKSARSPPEKLTAKQKQQLEHLCQASPDLFIAYHLSQEFVTFLKERQADTLNEWLKCAKASRVVELARFASGIYRDYAAVYAACSRPESNGITEGHVNRLKFLILFRLSLRRNRWPGEQDIGEKD